MSLKSSIKTFLYKTGLFKPIKKVILLYKNPLAKYRTKKLVKPILQKIQPVFEQYAQDYWIDYGTLLGYTREKKLLKNDDDLDFGIIAKESLEQPLKQAGFKLLKRVLVEDIVTFEQYLYKGFRFDIFYYREQDDKLVTNIWLPNSYDLPQPISYQKKLATLSQTTFNKFTTKEIIFYDTKFKAPKNCGEYLSQHYGKDYLIPNPNFRLEDELNRVTINKEHKVEFYE
jgi:phosphorylcholine metabolism protein LicD